MLYYISLLFASTAVAWNYETHFIIVRMAYDLLMEKDPTIVDDIEWILQDFSDETTLKNENKWPMVECAVYGDQVKRSGGGYQSAWHFDDEEFLAKDITEDEVTISSNPKNITSAMPILHAWLSGEDVTGEFAYESIMKRVDNEEAGKSLALRLLIHYYGDIHQPLHSVGRVSKENPKGDKGGNGFGLKYHLGAKNLHSLWDSVMYTYRKTMHRPFSQDTWNFVGVFASELLSQYQVTDTEVETLDFDLFHHESFELGSKVYDGLVEDGVVPQSYIDKHVPEGKRRMVLAGHRLAFMLEQLYGKQPKKVDHVLVMKEKVTQFIKSFFA